LHVSVSCKSCSPQSVFSRLAMVFSMEITLRYCEANIYLTGLIKWIKAVFMTDQLNEFIYQVWVPLA